MENIFVKKQSKYWDSYTSSISTLDLDSRSRAEKIEFEYLAMKIGHLKEKKLLDLGCGTGKFGLQLAKTAREVVGIDISQHSIAIANKTAIKYKIHNFRGLVKDFKDCNYIDYFDFVLAVNVLHHTDNINEILNKIIRSLKKNGFFIVFEINPFNLLFIPFLIYCGQIKSHLNKGYIRSNIFTLKKLIKRNGFEIKEVNRWCFLPTAFYNYSLFFKIINEFINKIPLINQFCAFHIIICKKIE